MMEKMIAMRNSKKKGFTLIELIVVIAILAILAALAVPAYNGLKKDSAETVGTANARTAYTAYKAVVALDEVTGNDAVQKAVNQMLSGVDTGALGGTVTVDTSKNEVTWVGDVNSYTVTSTYSDSGPGTSTAS